MPQLQAEGAIDPQVLDAARYFVTLHLGPRTPDMVAEDAPPRRAMLQETSEELSALLCRMAPVDRVPLFGGRTPRVKKAQIADEMAHGPRGASARARAEGRPLVAMRVVTAKRANSQ